METIAIVDPLTGSKLHEIQSHSATDVALMFQEGREAQPAWNELGAKARAQIAHKRTFCSAKPASRECMLSKK